MDKIYERYGPQLRLKAMGLKGQQRLHSSRVVVVGCGALGTAVSNCLVRAGIGYLRIIDEDRVELSNLHRQFIFKEDDVKHKRLKVIAARQFLLESNSEVEVEALPVMLTVQNALELLAGFELIIDATDNFSVRYLLNDAALELHKPWVYGGVLGFEGRTILFQPGGPCLRCIAPNFTPTDSLPSTREIGVFGPLASMVGALQATEAIKYLLAPSEYRSSLICLDIWQNEYRVIALKQAKDCVACVQGERDYLRAKA